MFDDPDDFGRFVGTHNWKVPMGMFQLGQCVGYAANQAWQSTTRRADRIAALDGDKQRRAA